MPEDSIGSVDMEKSLRIAEELVNKKDLEMPYGSLLFWISIIKRVEKLPENILLKDFHKFLGDNYNRKATVRSEKI